MSDPRPPRPEKIEKHGQTQAPNAVAPPTQTKPPTGPRWTDLIGIDPDYTDGRPVDEWLEANRRTNPSLKRTWSEGGPVVYGEPQQPTSDLRHNPHHLTPDENDISWAGLMELLDEHWPADVFLTIEDDYKRDMGARIVALLRWVDKGKTRIKDDDTTIKRLCWLVSQIEIQRDDARAALARVEAVCAIGTRVATERMVSGSVVHIAAKDAIDTFAKAVRDAIS